MTSNSPSPLTGQEGADEVHSDQIDDRLVIRAGETFDDLEESEAWISTDRPSEVRR